MRRPVAERLAFTAAFVLLLGTMRVGMAGPLDPRGKIHIPIGIPNTLDTLKTFVEAEGNFSPGFATYGIYFWVYDHKTKRLIAPTMDGVTVSHQLGPVVVGGITPSPVSDLAPSIVWHADDLRAVETICEVRRLSPAGEVFIVGGTVLLKTLETGRKVSLYAALRPLGPAGGDVKELTVSATGDALLVDGHTALVATTQPDSAGVVATDTIGEMALTGTIPKDQKAVSPTGDCSGALRFDMDTDAGRVVGFISPVLPGRRAVGHKWDGKNPWAQLDEAKPNPTEGGILQPDPGLEYYRKIQMTTLFEEAKESLDRLTAGMKVSLPHQYWGESMKAIIHHAALSMNDGAPDVAVINYNVFNRDGVYVANILQKSGNFDLAAQAIDYFRAHPFNGRIYPEADNPGQILWIMGEHWRFTRDRQWLERVYPSARKIVEMIRYYRTTQGPHWVSPTSLDFGDALPAEKRQELKPGSCDGYHPEYTEAFDIAGVRAATVLAEAIGNEADAAEFTQLADSLFASYDRRFGAQLAKQYGSYSVLWPCRLYPFGEGKAHEQLKGVGMQKPMGWRYFSLATAHQGLLAGNREAAYQTINAHLDHPQMRGWYAFDEGGKSGAGGWRFARTTWNGDVAMPHGWAIAELWLLVRDSLVFEDRDRLALFAGIPPEWFTERAGIELRMPTQFGELSVKCKHTGDDPTRTVIQIEGPAKPPGGFVLRLPTLLKATATTNGEPVTRSKNGDFVLAPGTKLVEMRFGP